MEGVTSAMMGNGDDPPVVSMIIDYYRGGAAGVVRGMYQRQVDAVAAPITTYMTWNDIGEEQRSHTIGTWYGVGAVTVGAGYTSWASGAVGLTGGASGMFGYGPGKVAGPGAGFGANGSAYQPISIDMSRVAPNPYGSKGKPDHQIKVKELVEQARGELRPGERLFQEGKIQIEGSNRRPDVQIIGPDGKTRKIFEAERNPGSKRNRLREEEYNRLGIPNETHPLDCKP